MSDESIMGEPHEMNVTDLSGVTIDGHEIEMSHPIYMHMPESGPTTGLWCSPFAPGKGPEPLKEQIENPYGHYTVTEG